MTTDEIIRRYGDEDGFIECADCPVHPKCAGYMSGFEDCWEKIRRNVRGEGEKRAGMTVWDMIVWDMTVALCPANLDHLWFGMQTHDDQAEILKSYKIVAGERSPCTFCRYAPPSAGDRKPCTYCPAEGVN